MKKYIPENMVKISRYQNFFPTLSEDIRRDIYTRMEELIHPELFVRGIERTVKEGERA